MGYKVCYLVHSGEILSYDERTNIFVGTPEVIEDYLYSLNLQFDYAVFDEIHNLINMINNKKNEIWLAVFKSS